jgi:hypothetical protein
MSHPGVVDQRIEKLREVAARLEQTPRSKRRDVVLRAVRDRIVALDTGEFRPTTWKSAAELERERERALSTWLR